MRKRLARKSFASETIRPEHFLCCTRDIQCTNKTKYGNTAVFDAPVSAHAFLPCFLGPPGTVACAEEGNGHTLQIEIPQQWRSWTRNSVIACAGYGRPTDGYFHVSTPPVFICPRENYHMKRNNTPIRIRQRRIFVHSVDVLYCNGVIESGRRLYRRTPCSPYLRSRAHPGQQRVEADNIAGRYFFTVRGKL